MSILKATSLTPLAKALADDLEKQVRNNKWESWMSEIEPDGYVKLEGEFNLYELASAIVAFQETTTKQKVK